MKKQRGGVLLPPPGERLKRLDSRLRGKREKSVFRLFTKPSGLNGKRKERLSDMLPRQADVIVIGGGIIGASVAYHLSMKSVDVLLLEKSDFASGTSSACDGMVFLQSKKPGVHLALAMASRKRFENLPEELDSGIELRCNGGMMTIGSDQEFQAVERFVKEQRRAGLDVSILDVHQARDLEPCLSHAIRGSTFCPFDAQVNPIHLTLAFLSAAKRHGAALFARTPVTAIRLRNDCVHAVDTPQGVIESRTIVNAAGVYAPEIGKMVGLNVPITPRRGQILVTEALPPILTRCLLSATYVAAKYDPCLAGAGHMGISVEQTGNGNFLLGSTREFAGFDRRTTPGAVKKILAETTPVIPRLKDAHLIRTFAGLRPYTPDGLPILGRVAAVEGFIMAAGHEGDGIALSPITGQLIAELIADGESSSSLKPFALERPTLSEPS
jgi:glycine/D-amino acid oxidase-like deaminating enzyme